MLFFLMRDYKFTAKLFFLEANLLDNKLLKKLSNRFLHNFFFQI